MTLIAIIAIAWIAVLGGVVALCRGASRGDEVLAAGAEELRRVELSAGVVRLEHTAADGIGFMAAGRACGDEESLRGAEPQHGSAERRERPARSLLGAH
jgi:hypothetical protein